MASLVYRGNAYDPQKIKKARQQTLERVTGLSYRGKPYGYVMKNKDTELSV